MNLKETYNRIAKDWMRDHGSDTWWVEGTDKFISLLPQGAAVLDVGCGAGEKSIYFFVKHGFKVVGVDFAEEMIRLAKEREQKVDFFVKDIKEPLNLEQTFDGVFAQAVLLHIEKAAIRTVLKNIVAPLKQGGYFYLAVKETRANGIEEEIRKEDDYGYEYERFFSYYTLPELKEYLKELGFPVAYESVTLSGKTNWIQVIAQKP